jgi:hypothetical protein
VLSTGSRLRKFRSEVPGLKDGKIIFVDKNTSCCILADAEISLRTAEAVNKWHLK